MEMLMNSSQETQCHSIIHSVAATCGAIGGGMAQVPGSDNLVIVPLQIAMVVSLGTVFGIELSDSSAKAALASATATTVGRGISQALVGWIPGYGNALNATTAFAVTEAIGWAVANEFSERKSLLRH